VANNSLREAQLTANAAIRVAKITGVVALAGSIIGAGALVGAAVIGQQAKDSQATNQTSTTAIDCTSERQQAIDIWRLHPEITIPYSGAPEQVCQLNEVIRELKPAP